MAMVALKESEKNFTTASVYMCQKLIESRQSYCNENRVHFLAHLLNALLAESIRNTKDETA